MNIADDPRYISFDGSECCVMARFYDLTDLRSEKLLDTLLSIFKNTISLGFIPTDIHLGVYMEIAGISIEMLEKLEGDEELDCGHTVGEHRQALVSVCGKCARWSPFGELSEN